MKLLFVNYAAKDVTPEDSCGTHKTHSTIYQF